MGDIPPGLSDMSVKLTAHFHLVPRLRMVELYIHFPIRLHGVVFNSLSTGTTLPFLQYNLSEYDAVFSGRNLPTFREVFWPLASCFLGSLVDTEDEYSTFLRNVSKFLPDCTASHS
jgi:hypothetical protein